MIFSREKLRRDAVIENPCLLFECRTHRETKQTFPMFDFNFLQVPSHSLNSCTKQKIPNNKTN